MAAKREIKTTLKLEGEQEYRRQMTDAAGAIKTLNSEQKLAEAQFKRTGDEQEYAASKAEILRKKIEEQKKAVAAAEAAVKELTANGVKPNDKAMQTWQTKLNNAKTGLVNMQTELDNTEKELGQQETALKDTSTETGNLQTAMDSLDRQVTLENVAKAIDTVYDSLMGVVRGVARAAKALWDWETEGADWADELLTTASQTDFDVETLQAWRYAAKFVDTEVEDIIKSQDKLSKDLSKSKIKTEVVDAYDALGVSAFDAAGKMRDTEDIFWDVLAALAEVGDETEQNALAQTLLGKSFRDLKPLLDAGRAVWDQYVAEGREVAVVSEDSVQALGELDDAQNKLTASLDKSKYEVLASLAPLFTQVSEAMATAVQGFNDFLQTEEGQAAMQGLADALSGIITSLTGEGGESFQTLIEGAKGALDGLTQAFDWIAEHKDTVVDAIKGIAVALGALKVASIGIKVAELAGNLKHLLNFGGGGGTPTGTGGGGGAVPSAAPGVIKRGLTAAGKWLGSVGASVAPYIGPAAGVVGMVGAGALINQYADTKYTQREFGEYNAMKDQIGEVVASAGDSVYGTILSEIKAALDTYEEDLTYGDVVEVFQRYSDQIAEVMGEGFDLDTALDEYSGIKWIEAGADLATALANGIEQGTLPTEEAASTMGANVATAVADGITENIFRVQSAMASLTAAATVRGTLPSFAGAAGRTGQTGATLNATIVMDRTRVGRLVTPVVDGAIGSTIRGRLG